MTTNVRATISRGWGPSLKWQEFAGKADLGGVVPLIHGDQIRIEDLPGLMVFSYLGPRETWPPRPFGEVVKMAGREIWDGIVGKLRK